MYYSQSQQDQFVDKVVFKGKNNGTFLEIGAYDGITYSNSYFFEKNRNWKGICVEPIPDVFEKLKNSRQCICVNACVTDIDGEVELLHVNGPSEMLTGIASNYNPLHCQRIDKEISDLGGEKKLLKIPAININTLLKNNNIKVVDFCSIDVEGSEWTILNSIDFDNYTFNCFTIENNFNDDKLRNFLESKGYSFVGNLGADQIFLKDDAQTNLTTAKISCWIYNITNKIKKKLGIL